jgi:hypothetical protein
MSIDVQCREICAFCERIFTQARSYIAHKCKARDSNDEPKDIYTRRRYEELRRHASKELDRMIANDESSAKGLRYQGKRRARVADDGLEASKAPKRAKQTFDDGNEATNKDVWGMNPLRVSPLHLSQKAVEPTGETCTLLQPPGIIDETINTNSDSNSHFSAPLFYHPVEGLTNGGFNENFSAPLFYEMVGGSNGASDEIFSAPIFGGQTSAPDITALQFQADFSQQALLRDQGGWT